MATKEGIWVTALQESKAKAATTERPWVTLYLSSGVDLVRRQEMSDKIKHKTATAAERQDIREHVGVAIAFSPKAQLVCGDVRAVNGRMMWAVIQAQKTCVLVNAYAPHAYASTADKDGFYEELATMLRSIPRRYTLLVGGDFNVRLGARREGEKRWIGPHTGPTRPEGEPPSRRQQIALRSAATGV